MNCKHNVVQVIDGVKSCELCGEIISVPKLSKAKWNQAVKNCLKAIDKGKKAREEYCLICNKVHNSKPINLIAIFGFCVGVTVVEFWWWVGGIL